MTDRQWSRYIALAAYSIFGGIAMAVLCATFDWPIESVIAGYWVRLIFGPPDAISEQADPVA